MDDIDVRPVSLDKLVAQGGPSILQRIARLEELTAQYTQLVIDKKQQLGVLSS